MLDALTSLVQWLIYTLGALIGSVIASVVAVFMFAWFGADRDVIIFAAGASAGAAYMAAMVRRRHA